MSKLVISDNLSFPLDAVTQTFAILGIRGSGKTNTAVGMVEEMVKQGQQCAVLDPTDAWYGVRSSRDGKERQLAHHLEEQLHEMKSKTNLLHLIDLDEPLDSFNNLVMRCGITIKCGEAKWMFADEFKPPMGEGVEEPEYLRGVCRACICLEPVGEDKRSMLYGIVEKRKPQSEESEDSA
jgi:hypothetical protein